MFGIFHFHKTKDQSYSTCKSKADSALESGACSVTVAPNKFMFLYVATFSLNIDMVPFKIFIFIFSEKNLALSLHFYLYVSYGCVFKKKIN